MDDAKFSVALCTFNGGLFLSEQLQSLRAQTLRPFELVVCDDRSTDATMNILEDFRRQSGFPVRIYRNAEQMGSSRNFEQAIRLCEGSLIALCDQDDRWAPRKLERLRECFAEGPEVGGAFSDASLIDSRGALVQGTLWHRFGFFPQMQRRFSGLEAVRTLARKDVVTGCTLAFRGSLKPLLLPIAENWVHDGWIALLLANVSRLVPLAEPLVSYRLHAAQQIGAKTAPLQSHLGTMREAALSFHQETSSRFAAAAERLRAEDRQAPQVGEAGIVAVEARARFHRQRHALLKSSRLQRVGPALKLLRPYLEYEKGWLSLLRDIAHATD